MIEEIGLEGDLIIIEHKQIENNNDSEIISKTRNKIKLDLLDENSSNIKNNLKFGQEIVVRVDFYEDVGEVDTNII